MTRLAIVGSGPAAFYTLTRVLQRVPGVAVSMFEKSLVPFGLTRFGVAPDHPEVKSCQERFAQAVAELPHASGRAPPFRFFGNTEVGADVPLAALSRCYDAVLVASGAQHSRSLGVPGESLRGVVPARRFVNWYNGDPAAQAFDASILEDARTATVIGNGNVALDIARMLLSPPERWQSIEFHDVPAPVLAALAKSAVRHVSIVGRRGLLQSAFTNKEFRELLAVPGVRMLPVDPETERQLEPQNRVEKRKLSILDRYDYATPGARTWQLEFWRTPLRFVGQDAVEGVAFEHAGQTVVEPADVVFTSIGDVGVPIPGLAELGATFDPATGVLKRDAGRVVGTPNLFASGWIATGARGAIASTMRDAFEVGDQLAEYLLASHPAPHDLAEVQDKLRAKKTRTVSWDDWKRIDAEELRQGEAHAKGREKFVTADAISAFLDHA